MDHLAGNGHHVIKEQFQKKKSSSNTGKFRHKRQKRSCLCSRSGSSENSSSLLENSIKFFAHFKLSNLSDDKSTSDSS